MTLAIISGALALVMILIWMWSSDPRPLPRAEIGHGIKVPTYVSGPLSHSWWAMVVLLLVAGSLYPVLGVFLPLPLDGLAAGLAET